MTVPAHLAFNARFWAYDPGRDGRKEKLVVRIRNNDGAAHSTLAKATSEINDQTDAGKQWSPEELEVTKVYRYVTYRKAMDDDQGQDDDIKAAYGLTLLARENTAPPRPPVAIDVGHHQEALFTSTAWMWKSNQLQIRAAEEELKVARENAEEWRELWTLLEQPSNDTNWNVMRRGMEQLHDYHILRRQAMAEKSLEILKAEAAQYEQIMNGLCRAATHLVIN
ncbi:hypothetical protein QQX98_000315 [Neonectria punicea]|uniref:Uncharacterized protein n=1 Tax=Neonectria punicea TaxID=979145 RepID=A0ABR1HU40_9HYPO